MYTGYVVKAGQTASEARVAQAIKNFGYENEDCICVGKRGYISEINVKRVVEDILDRDIDTPEEALELYLEKLNNKE